MPNTAKKIVIAALATGGIVAGVATASAAPLSTASPVAATSAEAAKLHAEVEALTSKEQALQTTLRARHHARPTTTVAPAGTAVTVSAGRYEPVSSAPTTVPPTVTPTTAGDDHVGSTTTEPTEPPESEPTTTTTPTTPSTTTTTWVDDGGHQGHDD